MHATTIAVDLAKSVFHLSVANERGRILQRRSLTRSQFARFVRDQPACEFVLEACATAHHWGREMIAQGHMVSILPAQYVRPFVRRTKTDRHDADALIQARRSGEIPMVGVKSCEQQAAMALHTLRAARMKTRTARINLLRGILSEQGFAISQGAARGLSQMAKLLHDDEVECPAQLRLSGLSVLQEIADLENSIAELELELKRLGREELGRLLQTVPGIGVLSATATLAAVANIHSFQRGRRFASWMGLTPREHSTGGKQRLGRITKNGDAYLRCLYTHGARSVLLAAKRKRKAGGSLTRLQAWVLQVEARRGHNKATIALANKLARIVWAVWRSGLPYEDSPHPSKR
jgi:transposase